MRAFWGKDKTEYNVELCFSLTVKKCECDLIRLIAKDIYNFTQNGSIVYGYNMTKANYIWSETHELEMREASIGGESWSEPVNAFYNGITAQQYFQGIINKNS